MFKISYRELRDDDFLQAMQKIANCNDYSDVKVAYNIARMAKAIDEKVRESQKTWVNLATEYIVKGPDGRLQTAGGTWVWKEGVDPAKAQTAIDDYLKTEVTVSRYRLKLDDLQPVKLSPSQLSAIEPLLNEPAEQALQ